MQSSIIKLPKPKGGYAKIFSISCLHIGSKNFDREKAYAYRDYILKNKDTYAISLGDDVEMALAGDPLHDSMLWDQNMNPQEQFDEACQYWLPLAKKGKLLWTQDSNHWWRAEAKTGISMAKQMNVFLNQEVGQEKGPKWGRWQNMTKVIVGTIPYVVHSWHGAGAGSTPESALRQCRAKAYEHKADCFLMGHVHKNVIYEDLYHDWPMGEKKPIAKKRIFATSGCFMKWDDSYGERAGYPMAVRGAPKIELCADRFDMRVSL